MIGSAARDFERRLAAETAPHDVAVRVEALLVERGVEEFDNGVRILHQRSYDGWPLLWP